LRILYFYEIQKNIIYIFFWLERNLRKFGSQMRPHVLWGLIWIQAVCKGYQLSEKSAASGLRVKKRSPQVEIADN
jgi:hypothetical protein